MSGRNQRVLLTCAFAVFGMVMIALLVVQRPAADLGDAAGVAVVEDDSSPFRAGSLPPGVGGARAPQFTLDDARGGRLNTRELHGRPYLVTFLYAGCRDVCPLIGQEIKQALERIAGRGDEVTSLAVSVDPRGDTPEAVREWLHIQAMPDNFRYLLGTRRELAPVWDAHYAGPQPDDRIESAHTASIWLIDRRGRWRAKFSGGAPVQPADLAHDLRILLDEPL